MTLSYLFGDMVAEWKAKEFVEIANADYEQGKIFEISGRIKKSKRFFKNALNHYVKASIILNEDRRNYGNSLDNEINKRIIEILNNIITFRKYSLSADNYYIIAKKKDLNNCYKEAYLNWLKIYKMINSMPKEEFCSCRYFDEINLNCQFFIIKNYKKYREGKW